MTAFSNILTPKRPDNLPDDLNRRPGFPGHRHKRIGAVGKERPIPVTGFRGRDQPESPCRKAIQFSIPGRFRQGNMLHAEITGAGLQKGLGETGNRTVDIRDEIGHFNRILQRGKKPGLLPRYIVNAVYHNLPDSLPLHGPIAPGYSGMEIVVNIKESGNLFPVPPIQIRKGCEVLPAVFHFPVGFKGTIQLFGGER